jgi:hypothetical protein
MWLHVKEGLKTSIEKPKQTGLVLHGYNIKRIILQRLLVIIRARILSMQQSELNIIRALNELQ